VFAETLFVGFEELALLSVTAFVVGLSGALMPGTVFVTVVVHAAKRGWIVGPLIVLGHVMLETVMGIALVLGLSTLMGVQAVRTAVGLVGGFFLLWMSIDLIRTSRRAGLFSEASSKSLGIVTSAPVLSGLVASSVNPYFYVWWATVGNVFTMKGLEIAGLLGVTVFLISHWMSDLSWYTLVSWSVGKSGRYMTDRVYRATLGVCGLFLFVLGAVFLYAAISGTI
jgi:threonine/homoserine/homoserine lactone efflux protein